MVRQEKIIRGYVDDIQCLAVDNTLVRLANHIITIIPSEVISFPGMKERQAFLEGKNFLTKHFVLHNIKSRSMEEINDFCSQLHDKKEILAFNQSTPEISPFKLKIKLSENVKESSIKESLMSVEEEELLNKMEIIFNHMELGAPTLLTPHHYVHEIVHSQLDSVKGSVTNPNNREVLSIFLELVSIAEKENSKELLEYKIKEYYYKLYSYIDTLCDYVGNPKTEITTEDYEENSQYIVSTLKALRLFRVYQEYPSRRTSIFRCIQSIFDKRSNVELFLKMAGVKMQDEIRFIMQL